MPARHILNALLIAAFICAVFVFEYSSQAGPRPGQEPDLTASYDTLERPGALFDHEEHQMEFDCGDCHHFSVDNGIPDPDDDPMEGMTCADCHDLEGSPGSTSLTDAFHLQCQGCHEKKKQGPVSCGECHSRS